MLSKGAAFLFSVAALAPGMQAPPFPTIRSTPRHPADPVPGYSGDGLNALGRHTVAALLNAASSGVDYGQTPADVIGSFNAVYPATKGDYNALKNDLEYDNERGCPLN